MLLTAETLRRWDTVIPAAAGEVLRFAAAELCHYMQTMARVPMAPLADPRLAGACLRLGSGPAPEFPCAPDGYAIQCGPQGITIAGQSERAVLYGVYRMLEQLGCRWSFHGSPGETVPALSAAGARVESLEGEPRYRVRAYASDIHTWHYSNPSVLQERLPVDVAFADWMAKTGANGFLFIRHPFDSQLTIRELLPEFRKRGIVPEYGGHVIPLLLPREEFRAHPELFPQDRSGNRTDLGNACTSHPQALRQLAENAVRYVSEYPEMGTLHIWGADFWDGGWCHCAACKGLSPQDQSLRVCNTVAAALRDAGLRRPICYLAYHDTIEPELSVAPDPDVLVEFAPRERCYGHPLAGSGCKTNARYREAFERYSEIFGGRVRVFEYYGDSILFCGCAVPLTEVIAADLDFYHRGGAREVSFLQFGAHSLWAHPLNFLAYAAAAWGGSGAAAVAAFEHDLGDARYGDDYWSALEQAMAAVVTYGDVRRPPHSDTGALAARLAAARAHLNELRAGLPARDPLAQGPLLEYTENVLRGVELELSARPEAVQCYRHALGVLEHVDSRHLGVWGRLNLPVIHGFYDGQMQSD